MRYITSMERRGIQKGERLLLDRQLKLRFGTLPTEYQKRLEEADAKKLLTWRLWWGNGRSRAQQAIMWAASLPCFMKKNPISGKSF